jgi:hypothetical protein
MIFINMNLKENISRIKTIMEIEEDTNRVSNILHSVFDEKLKSISAIKDSEDYVVFKLNDKKVFDKNYWGMLWVIDCDIFSNLLSYSRLLSIPVYETKKHLIHYLNKKYSDVLGERIIRDIGDDYCNELDFHL